MNTSPRTECSDPALAELLPWYANGTLDDIDQTRVQSHLGQCPYCEQALALLQMTNEAVAQEPLTIPSADPGLHSVMQRIRQESDESNDRINNRVGADVRVQDSAPTNVVTSGPGIIWQRVTSRMADLASVFSAPQWAAAFVMVVAVTFVLQQSLDSTVDTDAPYTVLSSEQTDEDIVILLELNQTTDIESARLLIMQALPTAGSAVDWTLLDNRHIEVSVASDQLPADEKIPLINQLMQQFEQHPQVSKTELVP